MSGVTQDNRDGGFKVDGQDTDQLVLKRLTGEEKLGRSYLFRVELSCEDPNVDFSELVGRAASVWLEFGEGEERYWSGVVTSFRLTGSDRDGNSQYIAEMRPWLWLLTKTADCRIFQSKTVPDIIKEVFRDFGFNDYRESLSASYRTWEYCVQYRETAFNFVSRLMEQEGIYYYFEHSDLKSEMVISDGFSSHDQIPGGSIPFSVESDGGVSEECITYWDFAVGVQPGSVVLRDYDFEHPTADLETTRVANLELADGRGEYEIYDYPGEYVVTGEGDAYSEIRLQELQAGWSTVTGKGDARALCPGVLFDLRDHPRADQNTEYLLTETRYLFAMPDSSGGSSGQYSVRFNAIQSENPFRAARTTPKPSIQGPQTALVVGPSGEEIHTDEHARVKLQFHWDRLGEKDENSSCWVRVSQAWAGASWGSIHIPRIGQEVIVEFLEGDPDRPIVTGRVYNADNRAPYTLPDEKTKSGIKSETTKGGGGFNELRFEDLSGKEEVYLHAQLNMNRVVENDEKHTVGNDRLVEVVNDESVTIKNDQAIAITNNQTVDIGVDQTESIGSNEVRTIGADRTVDVAVNQKQTIGADRSSDVGGNDALTVGTNRTKDVSANDDVTVGGSHSLTVTGSTSIDGKGKILLSSLAGITLECGGSSIKIEPAKITIKAPQIDVKGDMTLKLEGGLQMKSKGGLMYKAEGGLMAGFKGGLKADLKGGLMTGLTSNLMTKVKGSITKIN